MNLVRDDDRGIHTIAEIAIGRDRGVKRLRIRPFYDSMRAAEHAQPFAENGRLVNHLTGGAEYIQRLPGGRRCTVYLASRGVGGQKDKQSQACGHL